MDFDTVAGVLAGIPLMKPKDGRIIYDHILTNEVERPLELGFAHGVSSCYVAAALHERGAGNLVTIDRMEALNRTPNIHDVMQRVGLEEWISPVLAKSSYTWELMKLLETSPRPQFDFVFIDGAHTWEVDGLAFFLVDKMLEPGGWILFDDLPWTIGGSPSMLQLERVQALSEEERTTAQVGKVFDLLVAEHPNYGDVRVEGRWGWARKHR